MKQVHRIVAQLVLGVGLLIGATGAQATVIVNAGPDDEWAKAETRSPGIYTDRLTEWLGKGSLTLTSIFDADIWFNEHNFGNGIGPRYNFPTNTQLDDILSGKGPTITLLKVTIVNNPRYPHFVIGWYNPVNGVSAVGGNAGETVYDSFIFNLSTDRVLRAVYTPYPMYVSNANADTDFMLNGDGGGFGIYWPTGAYAGSFAQPLLWDGITPDNTQWGPYPLVVESFVTYSVSVDSLAAAVPEPATWAMTIVGFGMIGGAVRSGRRKMTTTFA